jgi:NAD(P)-dependent dehydrogenase (short-subunit alcohol dehydrogenase family)
MKPLEGKLAIVTGAGRYRGIGRHIALALARGGADIVVTGSGRPPDTYPEDEQAMGWRDVESVAEEVRALGRRALPLVVDVLNTGDIERLVSETKRELGRIDILVNNAASGRGNDRVPLVRLEESEWRRVIDTNLTGTFLVTKAVGQAVIEQGEGGRIINISSIAGRQGMPMFGGSDPVHAGAGDGDGGSQGERELCVPGPDRHLPNGGRDPPGGPARLRDADDPAGA